MRFRQKSKTLPTRRSVREDWIAQLPEEKSGAYCRIVRNWEDGYAVLSVALDEAFAHRLKGELGCARAEIGIAGAVVGHLADPLLVACRTLANHGRRLAEVPPVAPLDPEFYAGETAKQNAAWNQMLHRVVFASRSRFLHKLRTLELTVSVLAEQFSEIAEGLASGIEARPDQSWAALDKLHYDLNTCLREMTVVLKSFLRAIPESGLKSFQSELDASTGETRMRKQPRSSARVSI